MKIPPESLYYVLCYAWERLDRLTVEPRVVRGADGDDLPQNFLARLLCNGFDRVLRRGLDRGYREHSEETRRPRGKMDLPVIARRALRARGRVRIRYEELSRDVLHNRIVKTTMRRLASVPELDVGLKSDLMRSARRIPDVADVELRDDLFRRVQIHRNNADYGFLLDLCRLLSRHLFPVACAGTVHFQDFTGDDRTMGILFEDFVRGFLRIECPELDVYRSYKQIEWYVSKEPEEEAKRLPVMEADIYLPSTGGLSALIETKCVAAPFSGADGNRSDSLNSDHLYQLFAYLANYVQSFQSEPKPLGVLLYATAGDSFNYRYDLHGHPLWVRSVNLAQPWQRLRSDLIRLSENLASRLRLP